MKNGNYLHVPVMPEEVISGLNIKKNGIYVDGTLGGAGHALGIIEKGGNLIGIDRDRDAIKAASEKLAGGCILVSDNYINIKSILETLIIKKIDGALLDLGVSSYQLDTPGRGFSYRFDGPLDMRMDTKSDLTAKKIVNEYSQTEIERILFEYGEEPFSKAIAKKIVQYREEREIETTFELVEIIKSAIPPKVRWEGKHPAKRTFQAIRIAVNDELSKLATAIEDFCDVLSVGGRLAIITFHSLEDRIVKNTFTALAKGCVCPKEFPVCVCKKVPKVKIITKKPVLPAQEELSRNPRSASAKLRIAEKL
jgi:16S rRNA (cytosine1402-N4)-methyltransferase